LEKLLCCWEGVLKHSRWVSLFQWW